MDIRQAGLTRNGTRGILLAKTNKLCVLFRLGENMGNFHDIGGASARFEFTFMIPDMLLVMFTIFGTWAGFSYEIFIRKHYLWSL